MNAPLRRVGIVLMVLFGLLFANLNWVQAYRADEYRTSPYNGRVQIAEYERERGLVVVGRDDQAATDNEDTGGQLRFRRTYPEDGRWAHVVGYKPVNLQATGIEAFEDDFLGGTSDLLFVDRLRDLFTGSRTPGGDVYTTLSRPAQQTAFEQLRENNTGTDRGAAVALDPRTGAVQALVSMPSFDPNPLTAHDTERAQEAYQELEQDESRPLLNRALSETYPPGSVFKVVDTAAALQHGYDPDSAIPAGASYQPPQTDHVIQNASSTICPQDEVTLAVALRDSCNTGYAQLGVELGADVLRSTAEAFGFSDDELRVGRLDGGGMPVAASETDTMKRDDGQDDPPTVAQSAIGQANVRITPLQGALLAATVANGGVQMRPYVVQELRDADLTVSYEASPERLREPIDGEVAGTLREMMVEVVASGSGTNARIPDHVVGGKTGTAQSAQDAPTHGWFVGFVMDDGEPVSAVAVFLENAGQGGSGEAARIAGQVMQAVLADQGGD